MKIFKDADGFSLVELLIVVALIAIMVAIGAPAVIGQMSHQRLLRGTRELFTEINAAKMNAISKNTKYEVDINSAASTYQLRYFSTAAGTWQADPTRAQYSLPAHVRITSPAGEFQVVYNPNGTVTFAAALICLENSDRTSDKLSIQFTGTLGKVSIINGC